MDGALSNAFDGAFGGLFSAAQDVFGNLSDQKIAKTQAQTAQVTAVAQQNAAVAKYKAVLVAAVAAGVIVAAIYILKRG